MGIQRSSGNKETSGFFSKEQILEAAHDKNQYLFWIAAAVAVLTPFYMTRAFVITFLGKNRTENAEHAKEVGPLMSLPLIALAVMGLIAGFPFIASKLAPAYIAPEGGHLIHFGFVTFLSIGALIVGVVGGFVIYNGKEKDPISIPLFKNRFYLDAIYEKGIVKYLQDGVATIVHFFDEILINGILVGGLTRLAESTGNLFRKAQSGNLQAYAFTFGLGVLLLIYFTVFYR